MNETLQLTLFSAIERLSLKRFHKARGILYDIASYYIKIKEIELQKQQIKIMKCNIKLLHAYIL